MQDIHETVILVEAEVQPRLQTVVMATDCRRDTSITFATFTHAVNGVASDAEMALVYELAIYMMGIEVASYDCSCMQFHTLQFNFKRMDAMKLLASPIVKNI